VLADQIIVPRIDKLPVILRIWPCSGETQGEGGRAGRDDGVAVVPRGMGKAAAGKIGSSLVAQSKAGIEQSLGKRIMKRSGLFRNSNRCAFPCLSVRMYGAALSPLVMTCCVRRLPKIGSQIFPN
jgi:hypothetical protein